MIGIDDYTRGWPRLSNGVRDAELVADALERKGFSVTFKKNLNSTELKRAFEEFFILKGDDPDARLFVWFAGHGATVDGEGFLAPADAPRPDQGARFKLKALSLRRFGEYVRIARSKHALAVFDACFSGTIFDSQRTAPPAAITRASTLPVRQFLSSGDADQAVSDDGRFRKLFLRALNGEERRADANQDGYLTGSELGMFLSDRLTNLTRARQTPRYGKLRDEDYDLGDFVFLVSVRTSRAQLEVEANVNSARVLVDDRVVGRTPLGNVSVAAGTGRVRVQKEGYETYRKTVRFKAGRGVSLYVDLRPAAPPKGRIFVDIAPSEARVRILNIGPKFKQGMELEAGKYHVEASAEGYVSRTLWVSLLAGEDKTLDIALKRQKQDGEGGAIKTFKVKGVTFRMVRIPGDEFMMGSGISASEVASRYGGEAEWNEDEHPRHHVRLSSFYIGETEVTQGLWKAVMGANPSFFKNCGRECPVEEVSWKDVRGFIKDLNKQVSGGNFRLPTEAEWEYAARAGSETAYCFGNNVNRLGDYAWYDKNSQNKTHPVARKKANAWGLYDMHGNVWEWCQAWYGDYPSGSVVDPIGPSTGSYRVYRSGSWNGYAKYCRSAYRGWFGPGSRYDYLGFRLALSPGQ